MDNISKNLNNTIEKINAACDKANRVPKSVKLLAVSKTKPTTAILDALDAGQRDFGENYLQEAVEKVRILADKPIVWHYIGAIQSNKTKPIAEHFAWVHGVSELKHAKRLSNQRPSELPKLNICLQINIDRETNKSGILPNDVLVMNIVEEVMKLENLTLRGLMVIPSAGNDNDQMQAAFRRTRELFERIKSSGLVNDEFDTLSMGMSSDLELAIAEGATIVRVGTAIFGKRDYS